MTKFEKRLRGKNALGKRLLFRFCEAWERRAKCSLSTFQNAPSNHLVAMQGWTRKKRLAL